TPERREKVEKDLQSGKVKRARLTNSKPAVFIDRDGTLTKSNDYVRSPEALEVFEFAGRALSRLNRSEYLSILVTNQPVLARGELDERGLREIHNKLETELGQGRAYLDALYYCPHHPDKGFAGEVPELKTDCACRKPKTGMIDQAARELNVDLKGSWLIGDTTTDVATAKNAGLRSILVRTGYGGRDRKHKLRPDFEVADFEEAVTFILEDFERLQRIMKPIVDRLKPGQHVIVGGPARSGKSLVASTLRRMLHTKATVISLDGWLKPEAQRGPTVDSRYDLAAFSRFLSGLSSARDLVLPYYDRHTRTLDAEGFREPFDPKESLVFEGTIALAVPDLVKLNSVKVFVEASRETRWARFQKEYRLRGWSEGQIEQTFKARESEEIPFIMKTKAAADVALALDEAK
ncbi:MAG TPA: HAD-IIIA family hydrolase, partial [Bdellovibrionales bacterium]|nr:HAD-IIIA family hydrolase [Bdellovibrionales bacterium]